ncbi:MAG: hypothetical protein PVG74_19810 [Desulfobacterales bacterium]|jgi:hypothetical protein
MKPVKKVFMMSAMIFCWMLVLGALGWTGQGAPEKTNCNADIAWEVVKEAKLTQFDCAMGQDGGQPALIFSVGLMNPTDKPLRYRINIFLEDMDKAAGHLVPRKGKPPAVAPGEAATVKIPFIGTEKESKKILVIVKTISS